MQIRHKRDADADVIPNWQALAAHLNADAYAHASLGQNKIKIQPQIWLKCMRNEMKKKEVQHSSDDMSAHRSRPMHYVPATDVRDTP